MRVSEKEEEEDEEKKKKMFTCCKNTFPSWDVHAVQSVPTATHNSRSSFRC